MSQNSDPAMMSQTLIPPDVTNSESPDATNSDSPYLVMCMSNRNRRNDLPAQMHPQCLMSKIYFYRKDQ